MLPTLLGFSASSMPCHKILHISSGNWDKGGLPPSDHFGQSCSHFGQNEGDRGGTQMLHRKASRGAFLCNICVYICVK
jgi:hypothetical protein